MARKRKKHDHEDHVDESWLIPYADLLTLLLALFIVLFASSSIDAAKYEQMAKSFNVVFTGGTGVMDQSSMQSTEETENSNQTKKSAEDEEEAKAKARDQAVLTKVKKQVDSFIADKKLGSKLETKLTDEGLLITIEDSIFFDSGRAVIRSQDVPLAKEISKLLVINPARDIVISGHTDNVPIRNSEFESNWYLSAIRAVNFLNILLENSNLDQENFSTKGYGEFKPIASNDTAEGRSKNRRVEVLILPIEKKAK
ncbi:MULTISPECIES: flagellar motor protein MotB [Bacillus]|uniref:flagellar motor protein MotB n=1 Tax=Bacillus TaxID=1386 RepID=UPI0002F9CAA4|nr:MULTISPECIES: flagellar motor protein MotB [Bacillus]UJM28938.1 flagellar motor protein MotB [Bacillus aerophilus]AKU32041.1 flagellar motor protein MotB [Bacillus altitudinis]ALM29623.1 flagellar motor protein MotB [Bacillus altitudinis]ALM46160.1 flagellar motor protein MotB [Bacillus altitudinis]ANY97641.1 flagellar motor protein MotB [Bacillus altitudinis]